MVNLKRCPDKTDSFDKIQWNIGEIDWLNLSYSGKENSVATLRVIDPDLVLFPDWVDFIRIHVYSDTDPLGTDIVLTNTIENPEFFEGDVIFTHDFPSSRGGVLLVSDRDMITAKYTDTTLPDDIDSDKQELFSYAIIAGHNTTPAESVQVLSLRIEDLWKNQIDYNNSNIQVGHQILFSSDLYPHIQNKRDFAYLVQVQNDEGRTMYLSWLSGVILPEQKITSSVSWLPELPGSYTTTVFVWESLDNPTALSPPQSIKFLVK